MTAGVGQVPAWWISLTGFSAASALDLLREVERQGAAKNDRVAVESIWLGMRIEKAIGGRHESDRTSAY